MSKIPPILVAGSDRMPPINGPIINPRPNAAPIIPILRDISFGSLISPIYARATAIFPLPAPAKKRAAKAIYRLCESPKIIKNIELETNPKIITGLLP